MAGENCPNCGAPITGSSCPYCDTRFTQVAEMAVGKVVTVSFEHDGFAYEFDMRLSGINIDMNADTTDFYSDGGIVYSTMAGMTYHAHFDGRVEQRDGAFMKVRRRDG